jgi:hypothetical protein
MTGTADGADLEQLDRRLGQGGPSPDRQAGPSSGTRY